MNPTAMRATWLAAALVFTSGVTLAAGTDTAPQPGAADDVQDVVFLAEARPVLVRLHVRLDGKPLPAAWDDFMHHLFAYLDVNGDGVLSKEEAGRAPAVEQILTAGLFSQAVGIFGSAPAAPPFDALDTDKDGQVTPAELAAYYRKNGLAPFQVRPAAAANAGGGMMYLGGPRPEPPVKAVSEAVFNLLDADRDGKLTRRELAAAADVLLRLDEDDDEVVTAREVAPDSRPSGSSPSLGQMMASAFTSRPAPDNSLLLALPAPGEAPANLVRRLQERYGPRVDKPAEKKLSRQDLGLDEATFAGLDADGDGVLDAGELAAFVKRPPDLELVLRLGKKDAAEPAVEVAAGEGQPAPLAGKLRAVGELLALDLGMTRVDLRAGDDAGADGLTGLLRQQVISQFKQADAEGTGSVNEKAAQGNRLLRSLFKALDRDGDGKVSEKELLAYLDAYQELRERARAGCVALALSDESRGLFDLLDTNRDGRLSVREMRQAPRLLERLDRDGKGYLTREDVPHSYRLTLRRGPVDKTGLSEAAALIGRYLGGYQAGPEAEAAAGPLWFRKMDRNRDGDVSRKEFPFSDEEFRKLDADGDGLISLEEALKADAQLRKAAKPGP